MKRFIKKVAAVGGGFIMAGMAFSGAMAADLSELPAPFVEGGAVNAAIVVANTLDNAAGSTLQDYFAVEGGTVGTSGGYDREFYYEVDLNDTTAFGKEVDDEKVSTLLDTKIDWGDNTYDVRELINFTNGAEVSTSINTSGKKEFGGDPYLTFEAASITYLYYFDDVFKENDTTSQNLSSSTPLELTFLGKDIDISDISTTAHTITVKIADDYTFKEGESQVISGETVTVGSIFETSVEVTVAGSTKIISDGSSHDYGDVTVKVDTIGYNSNNPELSKVILNVGSKVSDTVSDGEVFELFTDYDPDNDAPWEWEIRTGNTANGHYIDFIGVTLRLAADDLDDSDTDPNPDPIGVGETLALPNDYVVLSFDETTDTSYCKVSVEAKETYDVNSSASSNANGDNAAVLIFEGDENNCFAVGGTDTDSIYAVKGSGSADNATWDLWYDSSEGIKKNSSTDTTFNIDWDDSIMEVSFVNDSVGDGAVGSKDQYIRVSKDTNADARDQNIFFNVSDGFQEFGTTDDFESGFYEVSYGGGGNRSTPSIDVSGRDYQGLTMYGIIIGDTDSNIEADLDANKVYLHVPNNKAQAVATIAAGSQVTGTAVEAAIVTPDEATTYDNLVLVGGPCVNSLTASWMGLAEGTCGEASTIPVDQAVIELMEDEDKTALIVAGWEQADTARAANTVVAGGLSGMKKVV